MKTDATDEMFYSTTAVATRTCPCHTTRILDQIVLFRTCTAKTMKTHQCVPLKRPFWFHTYKVNIRLQRIHYSQPCGGNSIGCEWMRRDIKMGHRRRMKTVTKRTIHGGEFIIILFLWRRKIWEKLTFKLSLATTTMCILFMVADRPQTRAQYSNYWRAHTLISRFVLFFAPYMTCVLEALPLKITTSGRYTVYLWQKNYSITFMTCIKLHIYSINVFISLFTTKIQQT